MAQKTNCLFVQYTHCLLLTGSGACTTRPNLHPLGASFATLTVPFFNLMAPIRF